ncbi:hypothetical protein OG984_02825 [Nocardioides sp. NBC_00368]|uniref:hypothetical protein n=1 Tax=Nocardioides sp. NBC_00368 TaxID=2976000 RepID=UPI002E1D93E7
MPEPTEFDDHLAIHAAEVAALEPTAWEVWIAEVERLLGHDADGDLGHWPQRGERTGYSLDTFHDMFAAGLSPRSASVRILGAVFVDPRDGTVYRLTAAMGSPASGGYGEQYDVLTPDGYQTQRRELPENAVLVWTPAHERHT